MYKKIAIILGIAILSMQPSDLYSMEGEQFNPEESIFSQKKTLKTWLAERYQNDPDKLEEIQGNVAMEVPQNPYSFNLIMPVVNNEGDTRYFGKVFHALEAIQLPFLQAAHQLSLNKQPVILEIAAGVGMVSWKIPYALENGGKIYINELSAEMVRLLKLVMEARLDFDVSEILTIVPGDCFDLVTKCPELKEAVDLIYVQQLEHFFNPTQHQEFITLISSLLAPGGRAFLSAQTVDSHHIKEGHPVYELYAKEKAAGSTYPGFMTQEGDLITDLLTGAQLTGVQITRACRPDDTQHCSTKTLSFGAKKIVNVEGLGDREVRALSQLVTSNFYTPTIYKNAIAFHSTLTIVDNYFMNQQGKRYEKFNEDYMIFAAVIIEKKAE